MPMSTMLMQRKSSLILRILPGVIVTAQRQKSHYDVLGITPKATQSDIKAAYYKLSKIHHPDKSSDEESAKKFRAITEAYEVLGNVKMKKMYDKGLIVGKENTTRVDYHPEAEPTDPTLRFYKSRTSRNVIPTMDGKTPIYDFDNWSQNHYGKLFNQAQYKKDILNKRKAKKLQDKQADTQEFVIFSVFIIMGIFTLFVTYGKSDYDVNKINKNPTEISSEK